MLFRSCSWPITSAKIEGRYFLYNASDIVAPLLYVRSRGSPAHPLERTYPCCLPALGEFGTLMPHGGSASNHSWGHRYPSLSWRIRIAAECARLESVYRETYRGFKSLILRGNSSQLFQSLHDEHITTLTREQFGLKFRIN